MGDKRPDGFSQEDASIEILSESGELHTRDSEWSIFSPGRSSIAGSEISLADFQKLSIHSKFVHSDGRQFIERRDSDDGGLPYSAAFYLNGELWKLNGEDCILVLPRRYISNVTVEGTVDLDGPDGFEGKLQKLLKHLKVEKVCMDKELEECNEAKSDLVMNLDKLADESGENIDRNRDVMLILKMIKKHGNLLSMDFKHDMRSCSRFSNGIVSPLDNFVTKAVKLIQRNEFIGYWSDSTLSDKFISDTIQKAFNRHRARLAAICPSSLKNKLQEFPDDRIMYVTIRDMQLFADLTALNEAMFEAAWPMIFSKFLTRVNDINDEQSTDSQPLSSHIFLYICKSMQEVVKELDNHVETVNQIVYSEALGWEVTSLKNDFKTSYSKCLRQQIEILAKLANHFEPGGPFRKSRFPYEFKLFQNMDAIPEPVRIWLCLLDDCMKDLVQACFFKSYVSFVASENFGSETLECLRVITLDALRSLAGRSSAQRDQTTSSSVLSECNKMKSCSLDKFSRAHFGNECDEIETTLQQIICKALDLDRSSDEWSQFSNTFKQLLNDLSDLQLEWFVRLTSSDTQSRLLQSQFIVPVDSIWKDTDYECYKVVDMEGFVQMFASLHNSEEMPKHYQLKVVHVWLKNLEKLVSGFSCTGERYLSDKDLLAAMTVMNNSIRSSLVFLNEQPDYCSFDEFLLKMSKACTQEEEVRDLPLIDVIDSVEMVDPFLYVEFNITGVLLKNGLNLFTAQYNKHLAGSERLSHDKRIGKIVSDVKSKIEPKLATSWKKKFRRNELPVVLAGLSAVWSIIVSRNDSNSKKVTKPSHQQICCILSIFGDSNYHNKNVSHRLLKFSSPEGKEFVLGLTAALFALYGHEVEIVCFNSFLTRIYSLDWIRVFRSFSILSNISYESFDYMVEKRPKRLQVKYMEYLNKCFGLANNANKPKDASEGERSILLIEDIDIILQYPYELALPCSINPTIPGLEEVQRKLFSQNESVKGNEIEHFIEQSSDPKIRELRAFLNRPHSYKILEGNSFKEEVAYTNKTLFLKHVDAMKKAKSKEYSYDWFIRKYEMVMNDESKYGCLQIAEFEIPHLLLLKSFPIALSFACGPLNRYDGYFQAAVNLLSIHHTIFESNKLQTISTVFDPKKDFHCVDADAWIEAILCAIQAAIDRDCVVLVFFKSSVELKQLQQSQQLKQMNVTMITKLYSDGEIPVLMVSNGHFSKDRPVHIIRTFFNDDNMEADLIRRQAERSHSSGSFELIFTGYMRCLPAGTFFEDRGFMFAKSMEANVKYHLKRINKLHNFLKSAAKLINDAKKRKTHTVCMTCA